MFVGQLWSCAIPNLFVQRSFPRAPTFKFTPHCPRFRFYAISMLCPLNLILGCRLLWCLSNFGRFLLVADHDFVPPMNHPLFFPSLQSKTPSKADKSPKTGSALVPFKQIRNAFAAVRASESKSNQFPPHP